MQVRVTTHTRIRKQASDRRRGKWRRRRKFVVQERSRVVVRSEAERLTGSLGGGDAFVQRCSSMFARWCEHHGNASHPPPHLASKPISSLSFNRFCFAPSGRMSPPPKRRRLRHNMWPTSVGGDHATGQAVDLAIRLTNIFRSTAIKWLQHMANKKVAPILRHC